MNRPQMTVRQRVARTPVWGVLLAVLVGILAPAWVSAQTFEAPQQSEVEYYHADAVGSVRLVTNDDGAVVSRHDYTPFGTPLPTSDPLSADQPRGFAGKERDSGTNFDYFGGRYLLTASSRFTTPDAPGNDQQATDPQSWSLYAYTRNNPLKFKDPDGRALDTIVDAASIVYDLYKIATEGATRTNVTALAADAASLVVPFATGGGAIVRAGVVAERGLEAAVTANAAAKSVETGKYAVGAYKDIKGAAELDAHHVGQQAVMKQFVPGYNSATAPAILVPRPGHTVSLGDVGVVSRNVKGFKSARDVVARDIKELRRVYPDVPNSSLQELIQKNKDMYPKEMIKQQ